MSATAQLRQLSVEFDEGDVCFAPGDLISGFVIVGVSQHQVNAQLVSAYRHSDEEEEPPDSDAERSQCFEIVELKMRAHGGARVKGKNRGQTGREQSFLDMELELMGIVEKEQNESENAVKYKIADRLVKPGGEKLVKFELRLPEKCLCTSLESKSASILYVLRVSLTYRNLNNEIRRVNAVRGFSVVECFDLARIGNAYFQPAGHHLTKKFGLFSCTGGQIRLHFSVNRSAFVCGENIIIEGRIDNRTDRRVDKVAAVLQQVVVVHGAHKGANLNLLDVTDIHEDNLALFVDQGTALKIERNFAIPPLPPSTFSLEGNQAADFVHFDGSGPGIDQHHQQHHHMGAQVTVDSMARRYRRFSANASAMGQESRFLKVLYQLSVRVKTGGTLNETGGVEVMEINVPILIGSLPPRKTASSSSPSSSFLCSSDGNKPEQEKQQKEQLLSTPSPQNAFTRATAEMAASLERSAASGHQMFASTGGISGGGGDGEDGEPMALFMHNRKEGSAKLGQPGETYICNRSQLNFTNKYPFFVNLSTSSKQSRKVSMLANAIRAENSFVNALRQEQQQSAALKQLQQSGQLPKDGEQSKAEWADGADALERAGTASTAHSEPIRLPKPRRTSSMHGARRASTLPPVEVLAEHLTRASSIGRNRTSKRSNNNNNNYGAKGRGMMAPISG